MLKAWALELKHREPEVLKTLEYENVAYETMVLFRTEDHPGGQWFVMGMQIIDGEHRKADMSVELNQKHFEVLRQCLEPVKTETLYGFKG